MSLKDITITSSINSLPTLSYGQKTYISSTDYESFPIETIIGGNGGVMPDLHGSISSSNLIVNITQSWSGSIVTPVGIVDFIDSTQNEFINGQFSGSSILISDGELSEDNPFLKVSTLETYYTPVYYYDIPDIISNNNRNDIPLSNFLTPNTKPDVGEIYIGASVNSVNTGPPPSLDWQTYAIKIATIDNIGNNNTVALQELESFKILFSTGDSLTCDITSTVDYTSQGYVLYFVKPTFKTGLRAHEPDGKVLNYAVSASNSSSISIPGDNYSTGSFTTIVTNVLGYLNINGLYTPLNTPNTRLYFTASLTSSVSSVTGVSILEYPSLTTVTSSNFAVNNITFSGSFTPVENQSYVLSFYNNDLTSQNITNFQFLINQYQNADPGNSDLTVMSPYFTQNFFYNDWNALYGNADGLEYDKDFMKVNYETGQSIPTNQEEIISGSAERAPVKPYNYSLRAQTLPRYEGVRLIQQNENVWTSNDISFGSEPSVKTTETYFLYFTRIYNTYPILKNKSAFAIKYLIDENGSVFTPNLATAEYYNLIDSFETTKKAYASLLNTLVATSISSTQSILLSGISYKPILYSISASTPNTVDWTDTIDFENLTGTLTTTPPPNYDFYREPNAFPNLILNATQSVVNVFYNGLEPNVGFDTASGWVPGSPSINFYEPYYEFNGIPLTSVNIRAEIRPSSYIPSSWQGNTYTPQAANVIRLELWYRRGGVDYLHQASNNITLNSGTNSVKTIDTALLNNPFYPQPNDKLYFLTRFIGGSGYVILQQFNGGPYDSTLRITTNAVQPATITAPFWITGSSIYGNSSASISLTSSIPLGAVIQGNYKQKNISGSGFEPIEYSTDILPGDEIRFEYDETNTYRIVEVLPSSSGTSPITILTLDRPFPVSPSLNIDHFTIRRPVKDFNVTLDTAPIVSDSGFLFPEYPSDRIINNISNITKDLNEKGLI